MSLLLTCTYRLTPGNVRQVLKPVPLSDSLTPVQGGLIEAIISFNLVFVSLSVTMSNSKNTVIPGLTIGLSVFIGLMSAVSSLCNFCKRIGT
jgi:glycerol uptake facilitator-like aquaporin